MRTGTITLDNKAILKPSFNPIAVKMAKKVWKTVNDPGEPDARTTPLHNMSRLSMGV
jgi:hypothetical protein